MPAWVQEIGFYDKTGIPKTRALVYGDTGTGKTRFTGTWPSPFVIDTDRGGLTLRKKSIPFIALKRGDQVYKKVISILQTLQKGDPPFNEMKIETIVIDSLTALTDMLIVESMLFPTGGRSIKRPVNTKPEWDDYACVQARLKSIIGFAKDMDFHFVCTAGTKLEKDDALGTFVGKPNLIGGFRDLVSYEFDEVYFLDSEGNGSKTIYTLFATKYRYFEAKSRLGVPSQTSDPSYEKLYG